MTTFEAHASAAVASSPSPRGLQYNHLPLAHNDEPAPPQILFPTVATALDSPTASSPPRPTISPSYSSSSTSSYASSDVRQDPSTPRSSHTAVSNRGFRLPRFSLWGRRTPDSLLVDHHKGGPQQSSHADIDLDKHHIQERASLAHTWNTESLLEDRAADTPELSLPSNAPTSSASSMPALTAHAPAEPPSMSTPKSGSVWRLRGGLFAGSASSASKDSANSTPSSTSMDQAQPHDASILTPPSQFAAWSELLHGPPQPNRSATFSSISSASCSSSSRPNVKKTRSQESIRSVLSARASEPDLECSYSSLPIPKAVKTKLRSKSKSSKELDFDKVFLAQGLYSAVAPSLLGGMANGRGSESLSPSCAQNEFIAKPGQDSTPRRRSWAPRRSTSPRAAAVRLSSEMLAPHPRRSASQAAPMQAQISDQQDQDEYYPHGRKVARQLSTSSYITSASSGTTASSANTDSIDVADGQMPKSPTPSAVSAFGDLEVPEEAKTKKVKAPTRKFYALQFSLDGRYLAAAGSDQRIRVYEVLSSPAERSEEIELAQLSRQEDICHRKLSSACSQNGNPSSRAQPKSDASAATPEFAPVFKSTPVRVFAGHAGDVMDLSWSKNNFLLSCSSDKTAKLWHPNRAECLCTFSTAAIVSSVDFHPRDDRFFATGGLDGKLRLWNIGARRVQAIHDVPGVITAVAFSSSGEAVCVGTHAGSLLTFACSDTLSLLNTVSVKSLAASKNTQASKITSIQPIKLSDSMSGNGADGAQDSKATNPASKGEFMTVTSNDSRVRIYSIGARRLISRFKSTSYLNRSSQIRATASSDSQFLVSGSEDASIHVWSLATNATLLASLLPASLLGMKRNKSIKAVKGAPDAGDNSTWRSWSAATSGSIRCAVFAPAATSELLALAQDPLTYSVGGAPASQSRIIVSTDDSAGLKVWRTDPHGRLI